MEYIKLIGVLIIVVGFILKLDTIATVLIAGLVTALVSGISITEFLEMLGSTFVSQRYVSIFFLTLPMIGLAEAYGLKVQAVRLIERMKGLSMGVFYSAYFVIRLICGLMNIRLGGHPSFVRPIVEPMGEAALNAAINPDKVQDTNQTQTPPVNNLSEKDLDTVKGLAAANENFGNFYGQNMFAGSAGVLLIAATMSELGYDVSPAAVALAAIPIGIISGFVGSAYNFSIDKALQAKYKGGKK